MFLQLWFRAEVLAGWLWPSADFSTAAKKIDKSKIFLMWIYDFSISRTCVAGLFRSADMGATKSWLDMIWPGTSVSWWMKQWIIRKDLRSTGFLGRWADFLFNICRIPCVFQQNLMVFDIFWYVWICFPRNYGWFFLESFRFFSFNLQP